MMKRTSDVLRIWLLVAAMVIAAILPTMNAFAQTQEVINATFSEQMKALVFRIDRIENMINAVLLALIVSFIGQLVQLVRDRDRRRDGR